MDSQRLSSLHTIAERAGPERMPRKPGRAACPDAMSTPGSGLCVRLRKLNCLSRSAGAEAGGGFLHRLDHVVYVEGAHGRRERQRENARRDPLGHGEAAFAEAVLLAVVTHAVE